MMRIVFDLLYILAGLCYSPILLYRVVRFNRYRSGWGQRFGRISRLYPQKRCIWLHAVSMGEINAARTVVEELKKQFEDYEIVISTTTDTGFARAKSLFSPNHSVFYFPFDFSGVIHRAFNNIKPSLCLLMELEVWPNFVSIARQLDIPVVVVNGRISEKSFAGYMKIQLIIKTIFGKLRLVLAQSQEYAERFRQLGVPDDKIIVTGSLKYDTAQVADKVEGDEILAGQIGTTRRLWVAGATGPDEEKIILNVYKRLIEQKRFKDLRLAIIPRKPERFDEVAQLIADTGIDYVRYSSFKKSESKAQTINSTIILGDTMGDLRKFYSLASIIFVGRSLVPMGGSDMMEAAALGKCTIFGPHAFNFKQAVDALIAEKGAILVQDAENLYAAMQKCLAEPTNYAAQIARNGREVIRKNQGATHRTIIQIAELLNSTQ
jgi:3-deoxy-D-manno-octulosonic-acid transferase